ncbi:hypothetical protein Vafri_5641, partial [Volvox africanus]
QQPPAPQPRNQRAAAAAAVVDDLEEDVYLPIRRNANVTSILLSTPSEPEATSCATHTHQQAPVGSRTTPIDKEKYPLPVVRQVVWRRCVEVIRLDKTLVDLIINAFNTHKHSV